MKIIMAIVILALLAGCSTPRVLVKDCKNAGPGLMNCEKVQDL